MDSPQSTDVCVIGGGPLGVAYSWFLKDRRPDASITVIERSAHPGHKIGESTLGATPRGLYRMGLSRPVLTRPCSIMMGT